MRKNQVRATPRKLLGTCVAVWVFALGFSTVVSGQLLYSYESDLQGWAPVSTAIVTQSSTGATQGTKSMAVESGASGYTSDALVTENGGSPIYNTIAATAGTGKLYDLKADVTFGPQSWTGLNSQGGYYQMRFDSNSNGGYINTNTLFQVPPGTQRTFHTATPLLKVFPDPSNLGFAQILTGKNSDYVPGTHNVSYYVDNVRIQEIAENRIFSWEDGPGGADNFDGWKDGFTGHTPSVRKIVRSTDSDPYGITSGNSAMQIVAPGGGFSWGTQFTLDGSSPLATRQALADGINAASAIRFDVTIPNDHFGTTFAALGTGSPLPGYLNLYLSVSDNSPHFYQSFDKPINLTEGATTTVTIPLDELRAVDDGTNLAANHIQGPSPGAVPTFLRFALATGTSGTVAFAIDNFRLIHDVLPPVPGDYSGNGVVDAADYTVWRDHLGQTSPAYTLPNDGGTSPGVVNQADYTYWKSRFGAISGSGALSSGAVPEPATWLLGLMATCGLAQLRPRSQFAVR